MSLPPYTLEAMPTRAFQLHSVCLRNKYLLGQERIVLWAQPMALDTFEGNQTIRSMMSLWALSHQDYQAPLLPVTSIQSPSLLLFSNPSIIFLLSFQLHNYYLTSGLLYLLSRDLKFKIFGCPKYWETFWPLHPSCTLSM